MTLIIIIIIINDDFKTTKLWKRTVLLCKSVTVRELASIK